MTENLQTYDQLLGFYIDGKWEMGATDRTASIVNPSNEKVLGLLPLASTTDLDRALAAAQRGFALWSQTAPAARARLIRKAAGLLHERAEKIARLISLEQGKPITEAIGEVKRASEILEWDAGEAQRTYGRIIPSEPNLVISVLRRPIGPVAAFCPWNAPAISPSRKIGGALAAGCSIILKASEETPATACALVGCFADAGVPPGVLNLVFGVPAEISDYLIKSRVIRLLTFTGSVPVGRALGELCARHMKPTIMELGGHSPVIVCPDADPVKCARIGAAGRYRNVGQVCVSPTRFLVHKTIVKSFTETFAEVAASIRVGDPFETGVQMGPLTNERRMDAMIEFVADARDRGAAIKAGGERLRRKGFFFPPTVLADVPGDARVMTTEPFGPIATITAYTQLDEAVELANSLPYGLAAYAFTDSAKSAAFLADRLETGVLGINHVNGALPETPYGGVKESGHGREGGAESLDGYMITRVVSHAMI